MTNKYTDLFRQIRHDNGAERIMLPFKIKINNDGLNFKDFENTHHYISKNVEYFVKLYGLEDEFDVGRIFHNLIHYYSDISVVFERYKNGVRDLAFRPVLDKLDTFNLENKFNYLITNYEDIFPYIIIEYLENGYHDKYDESFGVHYKNYFDNIFYKLFYKQLVKQRVKKRETISVYLRDFMDLAMTTRDRYSWEQMTEEDVINLDLLEELNIFQEDYLQVLAYHNSSPLLLTKL